MKKNFRNKILLKYSSIIFALLGMLFSMTHFNACNTGNIVDNPPPFVQIIEGPLEGEVITQDFVNFVWNASGASFQFRYRLLALDDDNFPTTYQDWTNYGDEIEVAYDNLDEGKFRFEVQGKSGSIEPDPVSRDFFVNAVTGPALLFFKTLTILNVNQSDSIALWMEDVDSLTAFHVVVSFDKSKVAFVSASGGSYVSQKRFSQLIVPDMSSQSIIAEANSKGRVDITSGLLTDLGSVPSTSISGSGKILNLVFKGIAAGSTNLTITNLELRSGDGSAITFNPPKNGKIVVK